MGEQRNKANAEKGELKVTVHFGREHKFAKELYKRSMCKVLGRHQSTEFRCSIDCCLKAFPGTLS